MQDESAEGEEKVAMTDLSERLEGPGGGALARELGARLDEIQARLRAEMRAGVPYGQMDVYQKVDDALASARTLMIGIIQRTNG